MNAAGDRNSVKPLLEPLTRREQEILELLAEGLTSGEMAGRLSLAVSTVRWYVQQIYAKLGVNGKREAITRARELGLIPQDHRYHAVAPDLPKGFSSPATQIPQKHNLPVQRTSFIGRQAQVIQVKDLLKQYALVTLTGSGGVGKTRLSLQVASELVDQFPAGVWLVELAAVADPTLVTQAVASILGLKSAGNQPIHEILLDYLQTRQVLMVLDNCEHLIEACAILVDELLKTCQSVKFLASSREALGVAGEIPFRVPSLTLPGPSNLPDLSILREFEAVRLFSERAQAAAPDFQVTAQNAPAVAKICQRLDGIPLAIELAASRLNVLTPEQLTLQLDNAFRLLSGGTRTALPRQQTLRAAIDWSFRLLSQPEQALLQRMSVFSGSFDLQAVEAVCCLEDAEKLEVLDSLASLVNKSMLLVEPQADPEMRYRLLETVRQYAREMLNDAAESLRLHDLHAGYYLDMMKLDGLITFAGQLPDWLKIWDKDFPNIRAALQWVLEGKALEEVIAVLPRLWLYLLMRGIPEEGRSFLERALSAVDKSQPSFALASLLCDQGFLNLIVGEKKVEDHEHLLASREMFRVLGERFGYAWSSLWLGAFSRIEVGYFEESAAIFKELGDDESLAFTLRQWGGKKLDSGDLDQAEQLLKESERIYRKMGSWRLGEIYSYLGYIYFLMGKSQQARNMFAQALPLLHEVDNQWELMLIKVYMVELEMNEAADDDSNLHGAVEILLESLETARKFGNKYWLNIYIPLLLARIAQKLGDYSQVIARSRETLNLLQRYGSNYDKDHYSWIGLCLLGLAEAAVYLDQAVYSARLLGALDGLREREKDVWKKLTPEQVQRISVLTRSKLARADFHAAWAEGRGMTLEQAIGLALEDPE